MCPFIFMALLNQNRPLWQEFDLRWQNSILTMTLIAPWIDAQTKISLFLEF